MKIKNFFKRISGKNLVKINDSLKPVGGTIFFEDTTSDGEYKFFDKDKNETTDLTKSVYYEVVKQGTKDRFYVVDTKTGFTGPYRWCHIDQDLGIKGTSIGDGKHNTQVALNAPDSSVYKDHNLWDEVLKHNADAVGGQSDWFIGSKDEIDRLIKSGLVNKWFEKKKWKKRDPILIWSSSERNHPDLVWYWDEKLTDRDHWYRQIKDWGCSTCFIRSF